MSFFLFRSRISPGSYYVEAESLYDVLADCRVVPWLTYIGKEESLEMIGDEYAPIDRFDAARLRESPCSRCNFPICKKDTRPLQSAYRGRKFFRYPGQAGEGDEDD